MLELIHQLAKGSQTNLLPIHLSFYQAPFFLYLYVLSTYLSGRFSFTLIICCTHVSFLYIINKHLFVLISVYSLLCTHIISKMTIRGIRGILGNYIDTNVSL